MHNDDSPLADTEVHYLPSKHVGDEFKVFVGHCGDDPHAVLCLTDANGFFGGTVDLVRSMQLDRHLPPLLVVGIGYRAGGLADTIELRTRDLTPSADPDFSRLFPSQSRMGGAAELLAFVRDELLPWVATRFAVDPGDTTYFGHSFGGLFGAYVLLHEPTTFRRYVIGSPSLWWDDGMLFDVEARYAQTHDDLPARAFFSAGANETHEGRLREVVNLPPEEQAKTATRYIDMVEDMTRFVDRLRSRRYPNLDVQSDVFPDEFHVTVPLLHLSRGLRYVFDAPR